MSLISGIGARARDAWSYRHEPESYAVLAESFWRGSIFIAAVLIIAMATYGMLTFMYALEKDIDLSMPASSKWGTSLDREGLQATLDAFRNRNDKYTSIKRTPPPFPDPAK